MRADATQPPIARPPAQATCAGSRTPTQAPARRGAGARRRATARRDRSVPRRGRPSRTTRTAATSARSAAARTPTAPRAQPGRCATSRREPASRATRTPTARRAPTGRSATRAMPSLGARKRAAAPRWPTARAPRAASSAGVRSATAGPLLNPAGSRAGAIRRPIVPAARCAWVRLRSPALTARRPAPATRTAPGAHPGRRATRRPVCASAA